MCARVFSLRRQRIWQMLLQVQIPQLLHQVKVKMRKVRCVWSLVIWVSMIHVTVVRAWLSLPMCWSHYHFWGQHIIDEDTSTSGELSCTFPHKQRPPQPPYMNYMYTVEKNKWWSCLTTIFDLQSKGFLVWWVSISVLVSFCNIQKRQDFFGSPGGKF